MGEEINVFRLTIGIFHLREGTTRQSVFNIGRLSPFGRDKGAAALLFRCDNPSSSSKTGLRRDKKNRWCGKLFETISKKMKLKEEKRVKKCLTS